MIVIIRVVIVGNDYFVGWDFFDVSLGGRWQVDLDDGRVWGYGILYGDWVLGGVGEM